MRTNAETRLAEKRNTERFTYVYDGTERKYLPDFIVNGELIEIKGYWTEQVREKIKQCPKPIKVLDKTSIKPYIDYVIDKYGRDFISLYETEGAEVGSSTTLER